MIIFILATVIILISALVYAGYASTSLPSDKDLQGAKSTLVWIETVGWISVIIIILIAIFLAEELATTGIGYLFALALISMLGFVGWLCASATTAISNSVEYRKSTNRNDDVQKAYGYAYLATELSLGSIIFLIVVTIAYYMGRESVKIRRRY